MKILRKFMRHEKGATAIEVGLIAPHRLHQGQVMTLGHPHHETGEARQVAEQAVREGVRPIRDPALLWAKRAPRPAARP